MWSRASAGVGDDEQVGCVVLTTQQAEPIEGLVELVDLQTGDALVLVDVGSAATNLSFIDSSRALALTNGGDDRHRQGRAHREGVAGSRGLARCEH